MSNDLSYRINTSVGVNEKSYMLNVPIKQSYDFFDILSLKISQTNMYKLYSSSNGVIVGRILAGEKDFGISNAKISIFIPYENTDDLRKEILYKYTSTTSSNYEGVRYNLLPDDIDEICHQDVGTLFNKCYMLDNNDSIEIFDKYYKYTTSTNNAGDYMIYGVPTGSQEIHIDIDLSDIGILSQRPRDMINKGYNINQFESPNKFKKSKNLGELSQIYTENRNLYVYPFWGDTTDGDTNASITRCDIRINYEFEPTCVFMGSIVTDSGENSISKKCVASDNSGKMSELVTGTGTIEMIRKTLDGKVQEFTMNGGRLIDGDGTWCYAIPMNLDYVKIDEYGNTVPTDDPTKGIATRTRVRFRVGMDETVEDGMARKRARFLIPNNPRYDEERYPQFTNSEEHEADYEFGTKTKEEDFCDMFINKVYTVKSYIPRLQKNTSPNSKRYTGIKGVNYHGSKNPMPYNNLQIKLPFVFRILCVLTQMFVGLVRFINTTFSRLFGFFIGISQALSFESWNTKNRPIRKWIKDKLVNIFKPVAKWFCNIATTFHCISVSGLCDDGNDYYPGCEDKKVGKVRKGALTYLKTSIEQRLSGNVFACGDKDDPYSYNPIVTTDKLFNCIENSLAQDNEVASFNFHNDWINGVLYAPMWFRNIKNKKKFFFGLITLKAKDEWCSAEKKTKGNKGLRKYENCALRREIVEDSNHHKIIKELPDTNNNRFDTTKIATQEIKILKDKNDDNGWGYKCHNRSLGMVKINNGLIKPMTTKYNQTVYYYRSVEYDESGLEDGRNNNIIEGGGDYVKLLFATDIVLLGSLDENDKDGTPQFFKFLDSTTYNMPNDLLTEEYQSLFDASGADGKADLIFSPNSDNVSERKGEVHTEITGADWGNHGLDQNYGAEYDKIMNRGTKKERFDTDINDDGGLFYGLNCNFSFVKPKSCINLSRVCEYGVQLDSSIDVPDLENLENKPDDDNAYKTLVADGYISYDEIYDADGRSMFATMNSNNLKTKRNKTNGLPMYDFKYRYVDNFDGSLRNLMKNRYAWNGILFRESFRWKPKVRFVGKHWGVIDAGNELPTYKNNYALENSNLDYINFRYGDYLYFYRPTEKISMVFDGKMNSNKDFTNRIPRYENSFYFYFGLNPGNTAIDKFREKYYSECRDNEPDKVSIETSFVANSWCTNGKKDDMDNILNDGFLCISVKGIDMPYTLKITSNSINNTPNCYITNVEEEKIYIGITENIAPLNMRMIDGYENVVLIDEYDNNNQVNTLDNGSYTIHIIDENETEVNAEVELYPPYLTFNASPTGFNSPNNMLFEEYDNYIEIANHLENNDIIRMRKLGGYITVNNFFNNNERMGGQTQSKFTVRIKPSDPSLFNDELMGNYEGSLYVPFNTENIPLDVEMPECPIRYPNSGNNTDVNGILYVSNSEIVFGVPKGGVYYDVTVTQLCNKDDCSCDLPDSYTNWENTLSDNSVTKKVYVSEPEPPQFLINDIDYEMIKMFETGWKDNNNDKIIDTPEDINTKCTWLYVDNITNPKLQSNFYLPNNSDAITIKSYLNSISYKNTLYEAKNENIINSLSYKPNYIKIKDNNIISYKKYVITQGVGSYVDLQDTELKDICFYNWPIDYTYDYEGDLNDINDNMPFDDKITLINKINSVLKERRNFSLETKANFSMTCPGMGSYIDLRTVPAPLVGSHKYTISYVDDSVNMVQIDTDNNSEVPVFTSTRDRYINERNNNMVGEFNMPTITVDEDGNPHYYQKDGYYKKPYYVSTYTSFNYTIPNILKESGFNLPDMNKMFGVHIFDSPFKVEYISWSISPLLESLYCNAYYIEDKFYVGKSSINKRPTKIFKYENINDVNDIPNSDYMENAFYIIGINKYRCYKYINNGFVDAFSDNKNYYVQEKDYALPLVNLNGDLIENPFINSILCVNTLPSTFIAKTLYYDKTNKKYYVNSIDDEVEPISGTNEPNTDCHYPVNLMIKFNPVNTDDTNGLSFLMGKITNGIESELGENNLCYFSNQMCGSTNIDIQNVSNKPLIINRAIVYTHYYHLINDEILGELYVGIKYDDIPSGANIVKVSTLDINSGYEYVELMCGYMKNYNFVENGGDYDVNSVPIEFKTQQFNISEMGGCSLEDIVYGAMDINVTSNTINTFSSDNVTNINFNVYSTNNDGNPKFYKIVGDSSNNIDSLYPLNNVNTFEDCLFFNKNSYDDYGILKYEYNFSSASENEDGAFTVDSDKKKVFFVVETQNHCRSFSPLYDLNVSFSTQNTDTSININNNIVNVTFKIITLNKYMEKFSSRLYIKYNITDEQSNIIEKEAYSQLFKVSNGNNSSSINTEDYNGTIEIVLLALEDVTGLKHKIKF